MKPADKKELLIRCWKTSRGTWLYYCHLIGMRGAGGLNAAAPKHMGMRLIEREEDLENVLMEILISIKKASPEFPQSPDVVDHVGRHGILPRSDAIPAKRDLPFCTHIFILERFFDALPVGHSKNLSCADCAAKGEKYCLKEYRFSASENLKEDYSRQRPSGIDLKGACPCIQME